MVYDNDRNKLWVVLAAAHTKAQSSTFYKLGSFDQSHGVDDARTPYANPSFGYIRHVHGWVMSHDQPAGNMI